MHKLSRLIYSFDDFTLDLSRSCLLRTDQEVKLRPKSFEVFKYLVQNRGRLVEKAELIQAVWPDSFVTDDSLVQCLIEVRRALGDEQHRYIKTVPRRGYIFDAEVIEHSPATPEVVFIEEDEGVRIEIQEVERENVAAGGQVREAHERAGTGYWTGWFLRRKLAFASFIVVALAASVGVWLMAGRGAFVGDRLPIESLAVIPLTSDGADSDMEYLSDGITDSIIRSLSQLPGLRVTARSSGFRFKGKEIDPLEVGRDLKVQAVLTIRVVPRGDELAINLELVDVRDNRHLWGENYIHRITEILQAQVSISQEVSRNLRLRLSGDEQTLLAKKNTENAEAYRLYLEGLFHWNQCNEAGFKKSIEYYNRAIEVDSDYALAYAGLANSYRGLGFYFQPPKEAIPKAKEYSQKALKLDDNLAEAHLAMAAIKMFYEWDWPGVEAELKRALDSNPNYAEAYGLYGNYLVATGRTDKAIASFKRALDVDPLSHIISCWLAFEYYNSRDFDQAIQQCRKNLERDPYCPFDYLTMGQAYTQKRMNEEAHAVLSRAKALGGGAPVFLAEIGYAYALSSKRDQAKERLNELKERLMREYIDPMRIAYIHIGLGEKEQALVWLEKAYEQRSSYLAWIKVDPKLDNLRSNPRFQDLQGRVGVP